MADGDRSVFGSAWDVPFIISWACRSESGSRTKNICM